MERKFTVVNQSDHFPTVKTQVGEGVQEQASPPMDNGMVPPIVIVPPPARAWATALEDSPTMKVAVPVLLVILVSILLIRGLVMLTKGNLVGVMVLALGGAVLLGWKYGK